MATKRLQKELQKFDEFGSSLVKEIGPKEHNLFAWRAHLNGPKNSPYEGGTFLVDLDFPETYPFKPPRLSFRTNIYHPSICRNTGKMCQEIIEDGWKPSRDVSWVLNVVSEALANPSTTSPLEPDIATEYERTPTDFHKNAKEWTRKYAK